MIRVYQRPKKIHLFLCALFGVTVMPFGGNVLAATAPTVTKLEFKDTMGTADPSDDKPIVMATGFKAYRVALDAKGNAYATDPEVNTVYKFNSNGHLVATYRINLPLGVVVDDLGNIYVSGMLNGQFTVFVLDQTGTVKGNIGNKEFLDMAVDSLGRIVAVDRNGAEVRVLSREGTLLNLFGPYVGRYNTDPELSYARTRHRFISAGGVAADSPNNEIYVTFKEYVEYLNNVACGGDRGNCSEDPDAYTYYSNTDPSYKYWYPAGSRYQVLVIDRNSGLIKRKIPINTYLENGSVSLIPWGLTLDRSGRLYVATYYQGIKVYDASTGGLLTPNGGFDAGHYFDLEYDEATGRVFATIEGRAVVYGIDGAVNPANTPPSAPTLAAPKGTYAAASPVLKVLNAWDSERDPLTYGYEIKDSSGAVVNTASGISEGSNGETSLSVSTILGENALYRWRAQAFDGNAATWSGEAEFCVNEKNDNPSTPTIIGPNGEKVSPFSSSLSWNPSSDPDCYDTLSYTVEVSNNSGFSAVVNGIGNTSLSLSSIKGLANGGAYSWRVKAVDNNGGESAYSEGSFVYNTTVVRFESGQSGAKVYIDGNYGYFGRLLGQTPVEVQDLTPGSHFVTFVKAGYEPYHTIGYEPYHTIVNVADPMVNDSVITVSAKWVKASRIEPEDDQWVEIARVGGYASPFVVDYNNDGLKDMIVGGGDGKLYLYLSEETVQADGTKKAVLTAKGAIQAGGADISVGTRAVPFVVDYNNDGRKDLLVGSGDGPINLYLNTGYENAPALTSAGTIKDSGGYDIKVFNSAPVVVDYNNDGKKDLVVGGFDGKLRLYKNIGTDASPKFDPIYGTITALDANLSIADINVGSNSKPFFTDWNSDGKKDLVVGREIADSEGSTVNLFLNVGTDDSPSFATAPGLKKWIMEKKKVRGNREFIPYLGYNHDLGNLGGDASPFVVDWDGSSARDVVVGNGGGGIVTYTSE